MALIRESNSERRWRAIRARALSRRDRSRQARLPTIHIGTATCGIASGALETRQAFETALAEQDVAARIHSVGCMGHCYAEPLVVIHHPEAGWPPILYHEVTPGKARMLVRLFLKEGDPRFEHVYGAMEPHDIIPHVMAFHRFNQEKRVVLEKCGRIDPEDIFEYIAVGGYQAFIRALGLPPEEIISRIGRAGLRGRGGAGFPTGRKWDLARHARGTEKIVICNADEGDPGAYMDRTVLESNPHQVLEGMAIGALAVGARKAVIYIRSEYPLAVKIARTAIRQATELGILGKGILGSKIEVGMEIFQGSGAFVCGEETALIQSMAGYRGMPRHRPPYPAQYGLHGRPTVINNVKTFASVPSIIERGAGWYRQIGTRTSPGTAVFSVVGNVVHAGLVEIPMGVTLRSLIFDICGGIPNKRKFKAVQIGGPSGGLLPESCLDIPIDFESLKAAGAMMGSGGIVVMDENTCVVDIARYFIDFTKNESCGKCTFCRIGTCHMLRILTRITKGEGTAEDLAQLKDLGRDIQTGSLCGLGKTAPNPVLTSLMYFEEEYMAHVHEKRCPGRVCRALTAYYIDLDDCARGCDACVGSCPVEAVFTTRTRKKGIDQGLCVKCGECQAVCPPQYDAVRKVSPATLAPTVKRPPDD